MQETNRDDITVHAYRVVADFKIDSSSAAYPLGHHTLPIRFRQSKATRESMIYVPDVIGMSGSVEKKNSGENMLEPVSGWEVADIVSRQHINTIADAHRKKTSYSAIETKINIYRRDRGILLAKILLPFLYIMVLTYLLFYISSELLWIRFFIELALLFIAVEIHTLYKYIFPGQEIADSMLSLIFVLILFSVLINGASSWLNQRGHVRRIQCILYTGRCMYPAVAIAGIGFLLYSHSYLPWFF